ncbi:hypothetical protein [Carboxylicivirga sp. RSCT41]|uniref:hypothetical protein n=1 Tax=Carboxylicivirga agarovorans TaxID=3417570 RepID=UPI003D32AF83
MIKLFKCYCLLTCFLLLNCQVLVSQPALNIKQDSASRILTENSPDCIYVHTDREIYSVKDSVWFKVYLTESQTNFQCAGIRSVYVELLDESDSIVHRNVVRIDNGYGKSDMDLSKSELKEGNYLLRAYTEYQQNFGNEFFFKKKLLIIDVANNTVIGSKVAVNNVSASANGNIDFQFLPEGGFLINDKANTLGFIARTQDGRPIEVKGWIRNSNRNKLIRFESVHDGMGKTMLIPQKGEKYYAVLDNYKDLEIELPQAIDGVKFTVGKRREKEIHVKLVSSNSKYRKLYLVNTAKGLVTFAVPIEMNKDEFDLRISKEQFLMGINELTLTDDTMKPLAERLIFIKNESLLNIELHPEKLDYANREKVDIEISTMLNNESVASNLSITAINANQVRSLEEYPQNILSYCLLDSELKGMVFNPSYYFKDNGIATNEKLDLLMLTHGWRNYNWNNLRDTLESITHAKKYGLEIQGKVKRLFSNKGIKRGDITLFLSNRKYNQFELCHSSTDSLGLFKFSNLNYYDSTQMFIQGLNHHGKKSTEIVNVSALINPPKVFSNHCYYTMFDGVSNQHFNRMAEERERVDQAFFPEKYTKMIDEIKVKAEFKKHVEAVDGHFRLYGEADRVFVVKDEDFMYMNVMHYIDVKWPSFSRFSSGFGTYEDIDRQVDEVGEAAIGDESRHDRYRSSRRLILLDGMPVDSEFINTVPMSTIDKVEFVDPSKSAIFGVRGYKGALAVYTKKGSVISSDNDYLKGAIFQKLKGYYKARDFYSPKYTNEEVDIPDHRATLYWNPEVITNNDGKAKISFYTSDDRAPVCIYIEGLSENGKPGVGFIRLNMGSHSDLTQLSD